MGDLSMKARVCVLGARGMIGRHLVQSFAAEDSSPCREELDLYQVPALAAYLKEKGVDLVVNAVGASGAAQWRSLYEVNSFVARHVAQACAMAGTGLVYLSSARVYNGKTPDAPDEDTLPAPRDDYGLSKFLGERFSQMCGASPVWILRLPMVLGPRLEKPDRQVVTRLLQRALQGQATAAAVDVFTQVVHVSDVARAVQSLVRTKASAGCYHLTSKDSASLHEIVSRVFSGLELNLPRPAKSVEFNDAEPGPSHLVLAAGRLSALCPQRSWCEAVDTYLEDLQREQAWTKI